MLLMLPIQVQVPVGSHKVKMSRDLVVSVAAFDIHFDQARVRSTNYRQFVRYELGVLVQIKMLSFPEKRQRLS